MTLEPEDLTSRGVWYLATPYSKWKGGHDDAAHQAALITTRLQNRGLVVYSPIVHSHALCVADKKSGVGSLDHLSHAYWLDIDRVHIDSSCGLIIAGMDGWKESTGITQEIEWYRQDYPRKTRLFLDPAELLFQFFA